MSDRYLDLEKTGIVFQSQKNLTREHIEILKFLCREIYTKLSKKLNYDHISIDIPRINLNLKYNGKRYDIGFIYKDRLVLIQVETLKFKPCNSIK